MAREREITSWDKRVVFAHGGYPTITAAGSPDGEPARLVLWPEGAPDRSEVPQAGEVVTVVNHSGEFEVRHGIPHLAGIWYLRMTSGDAFALSDIHRIPDAPTVKIGPKTYDLADAVARCEPLEEV